MPAYEFDYIKKEVREISDQVPRLSLDNAFVVWFLRAFFTDDQEQALTALTGAPRDKGIDAIHIDQEARTVFVVQGKYYQADNPPNEKRADLMAFATTAEVLSGPPEEFRVITRNADAALQGRLEKARRAIVNSGFRVGLLFVTTGKVSKVHADELESRVARQSGASLQIFDRRALLRLLHDYVEGAAPPVPRLRLLVLRNEQFKRYDPKTGITSWIFAMAGREMGKLYEFAGLRIFARNIRGYLGHNTDVNRGMRQTLQERPDYFWYFNNGVTIICDSVDPETDRGQDYLAVTNPQIINGQQTTRTLSEAGVDEASVLVKLIVVNRDTAEGHEQFGQLVSKIVAATNFQNEIRLSDLRANDEEQVRLERELRKWGVLYIRKRQSRSELRRVHGSRYRVIVKKEDMARSIAGCLLDPSNLRLGKERLFDEANYPRIFNGRPALEYLKHYWMNEAVRWRVGGREQGYARWLVLNFVWAQFGDKLKRPAVAALFCEGVKNYNAHSEVINPLLTAIDCVFYAAMDFYRKNRSTATGNLDASSFFRYTKLHDRFKEYWSSTANARYRRRFAQRFRNFAERLEANL